MNKDGISVYAIDTDGRERRIKTRALKLVLADGAVLQLLLDDPEALLVGTHSDAETPARLLLRPGAANAVRIAVEVDTAALAELPEAGLGSLDLAVQYADKPKGTPARKQIRKWVEAALASGLDASLTVRVVDEREGCELNHGYRGKEYATNVLSFAFNEGEPIPGMEGVIMGDLVLCAPVVAEEAQAQGKKLDAHWAHLVVHGVLHLQGYDHQDEVEAEAMESLETAILMGLGFPDPYESEKGAPDLA